jgi:hypothetical protein
MTAGLHGTSGDRLSDVGLPAKSGIGGGIVTVPPGRGGEGTFGQLVARRASDHLGMGLRISQPAGWVADRQRTGQPGPTGIPIRYHATKNSVHATVRMSVYGIISAMTVPIPASRW